MILFYNFQIMRKKYLFIYLHMYIPSTKKNRESIIIIISSCVIVEEYIYILLDIFIFDINTK